jgi:hypothetical protein
MKPLIFIQCLFLVACSAQTPKKESGKTLGDKIIYKSFLNFSSPSDSGMVKDVKDLYGEWEISHIAGEPEFLPLEGILKSDSLWFVEPLIINERECSKAQKQDAPSYRIEKVDVNDDGYNFKGTSFFRGYALDRNTVDYLWVNDLRIIEIINKNELTYPAGSAGKYYFYIYHRKK